MGKPRSSKLVLAALVAGVVLLVLSGLGLLGAYFFLIRDPVENDPWVDPLAVISQDAIAADLAVLTLAGESDDRVIRAAIDLAEYDTAYAVLAYSTLLADSTRSGHWLLLAAHYAEVDPARSRICYQAALDQVALAPNLADVARADIAVQVGRGLGRLDRPAAARLALVEAEAIARYGLGLLPAQRRAVLTRIVEAYRAIGAPEEARDLAARIDALAAGSGVAPAQADALLPTLRGSVTMPAEVTAAIAAREQAAALMAGRWLSVGASARTELAAALGEALVAEDAARLAFYAGADSLALADRLALLHDQIAWLTIKSRVAQLGYGVSLVPAWEPEMLALEGALAGAYTELVNGYGRQLDVLDAVEAEPARVELLRQGLMWVRLGLFPGNAEQALSDQLTAASHSLWTRQGGSGLLVLAQEQLGRRFYVLAGTGSGAEPAPAEAAGG